MHLLLTYNYTLQFLQSEIKTLMKIFVETNKGADIVFIVFFFYVDLFAHAENEEPDFQFVLLESEQLVHATIWIKSLCATWLFTKTDGTSVILVSYNLDDIQ